MDKPFDVAEIRAASLSQPFDFTKGAPLLRVPMSPQNGEAGLDAVRNRPDALQLFDLARDPGQENPIENPALVARFRREIAAHMARHDAPAEMYDLYGLDREQQDRMAAT